MPKEQIPFETLLTNLHSADWATRCEAARLLGQSRDPRAVDALLPDLADADWRVRRNAAQALGALRDPRAVSALLPLLNDRTITVRQRVVVALGRIKDPQAIAPLLHLMLADNSKAGADAYQALRKFGKKAGPAVWALAQAKPVEPLLRLLVALKYPQTFELLVSLLAHGHKPLIVTLLGALGDARAIAPLCQVLATSDVLLQSEVVLALGQLKAQAAAPQMLALLSDPDLLGARAGLYRSISQAFQQLGGIAADIENALPAKFPMLHFSAGGSASLPEVFGLLSQSQQQQLRALPGQLEAQMEEMAQKLNLPPEFMEKAVEAAAWKIGVLMADAKDAREERIKLLLNLLHAAAPLARAAAALSLPWYVDAQSLAALRATAQKDPDATVRTAAAWAAQTLQKVLAWRSP